MQPRLGLKSAASERGADVAMQIGEMLVRAKALTPADLEEAVSWQVLYGGRLGTNLLELGLVDERVLAECLGRQLGCEWACGEFELSESMLNTIPAVMARRQEIVPWKVEGKKFKVFSLAPAESLAMFDEIGFRLGKIVKPVVIPEFRLHQLLRRHYGSVRQMRALDFGVTPKGKRRQDLERQAEVAALEKSADLMDDEAFSAIYRQVMEDRSAGSHAAGEPPRANLAEQTPVAPAAPAIVATPTPVAREPSGIPPGWSAAPPSSVAPFPTAPTAVARPVIAPFPTPAPAAELDASTFLSPIDEDDDLLLLDAELIEDSEPVATDGDVELQQSQWASAFSDIQEQLAASEPAPPPPADLSPLSFKEAVAEIARATDREAVAHAVLRYARSKAARAVLIQVQGDVALGWDAVGDGLTLDVARRIAFPLTAPGAFRLVRESRSHYIGPLGKESGNVRFLKLAGKKWPSSAVLLPVLFRGRVVYILYVDNGHRQQVDPDIGELLILSQNITRSMEQLVARRQVRA